MMIKRCLNAGLGAIALSCVFFFASSGCAAQADPGTAGRDSPKAKVTYVANEGVMIEAGGKKVLIDALHRFYKDAYAYPPDEVRKDLEAAKGMFSDVDLILVSHNHGDHFSAEAVLEHLTNNSETVLVSSPQVVEAVSSLAPDTSDIRKRMHPAFYSLTEETCYSDLEICLLSLRHANAQFASIQNFGHIIELGGLKFLHIGDADMTDDNFESFFLGEKQIDVAFIPYWFLLSKEGRDLVDGHFKPKHIIAVHIPPSEAEVLRKQLEDQGPRVTAFTRILETKEF